MSEPKICWLNRKPYRDARGRLRERNQCCGQREEGCTLTYQPEGVVVKENGE